MKRFTLAEIEEAAEELSGFCIACGAHHESVDPDACGDECEECGEPRVYGAEEIALMGLIKRSAA